jgi:predicted transcriptional regulator
MKDMWLCARLNILPLSEYINEFDFPYGPVVCTPSNGHSPGILATSLMKEKKELFRVEEKEDVAVFSLLPERKKEFKTIVDRMGIGDEIARVHEFVCKLYKDGFKKAEEFFKTLAELFQLLDAGMSFQYMHSRRRARVKRKSLEEIFIKVAQCCMHSLVSIGEISEKTGISKSTLYKWVGVWSEKGFFEVESGSFRLTEKGLEMLEACEKSRALKLEGQ